MTRVFLDDIAIQVPGWVTNLESFRSWSEDEAFPEKRRIAFLIGEVWIDLSKEQLFTHNQVKTAISAAISPLAKANCSGRYFTGGAFLSNIDADVSNQPDGTFVSTESFRTGQVRIIEGRGEGHVELEGSPDMVLEVISRSSVEKDTVVLRQAYANAGIREYWLIDARSDPLQFDLLRLNGNGYRNIRKTRSWVRSEVFERWFRLTQEAGPDGFPDFTLEVREDRPT